MQVELESSLIISWIENGVESLHPCYRIIDIIVEKYLDKIPSFQLSMFLESVIELLIV